MKIKILLFSALVSANILADEYIGTVSIVKQCFFYNPYGEFYQVSSISHEPKRELASTYYPHTSLNGDCENEIEVLNTSSEKMVHKYFVMPKYMPALNRADEIYLLVKITLAVNNLFQKVTHCYLPLNLFMNDGNFKAPGDVITLEQTFIDYKNEQINSTFKLTLDNTFNDIGWHYEEFLEDFQKPCHLQTKNCLVRAFKRLRKQLGY